MPDKKDTQSGKYEILSVFSNETKTNPFGRNVTAHRAYRRVERIAAVAYVLTRNVSDNEPLKTKVREASHALVAATADLEQGFRPSQDSVREKIEMQAHVLGTLIRLLALGGYISSQNMNLTLEALDDLVVFLRQSRHSLLSEKNPLTKGDLSPLEANGAEAMPTTRQPAAHSQHKAESEPQVRTVKHGSRQETILTLLRKSGALGIKDIAAHLTDCGEKTVQRELAALVEQKKLKKEGEKRWSKYTLA